MLVTLRRLDLLILSYINLYMTWWMQTSDFNFKFILQAKNNKGHI